MGHGGAGSTALCERPQRQAKNHLNHRLRLFAATILSAGAVWPAAPAWSQSRTGDAIEPPPSSAKSPAYDPVAQSDASVGDIIVTAQKRQQNLADVPMSITAVSGDVLQQKGIQNVQDLAKLTPGLSFVDSGASVPVYSLRGIGFFDTALAARPTVSVYVDEVPLPFSIMTTGASFDLERVEVLKGPQGTLFGQNATGGAINYIAAKPTSTFEAGVNATYARFNAVNLQGFVSGALTPTLNVRVAANLDRSDDWQYSITRRDSLGGRNILAGRAIADWRPTDGVKFELNVNGFRDRSDTQAAQFIALFPSRAALIPTVAPALATYPIAPQDNRAADWDPNTPLKKDNRFFQASLRSEFELSDAVKLTSITAYSHFDLDQTTDQDGTAYNNALTDADGKISSFSQELRLSGDIQNLQWILGASYGYDEARENNVYTFYYNTTAYVFAGGPVPALRQLSDEKFNTYAVFGNLDYDLTRTVTLHGGIRYTKADLSYNACTADYNGTGIVGFTTTYNAIRRGRGLPPITIAPNSCTILDATLTPAPAIGTLNEDNISWRAGIDWKPARDTLLYLNVSRGYKAGGLPTVNGLSTDNFKPATQESVLAYELGARTSLFDRKVDLSGALFYYDYSDKQLKGRVLLTPNLFGAQEALVNIPKSRVQGAEAQVSVRPYRGLSLTVAGTYIDSKVQSDFNNYTILGSAANFKGEPFPYTPKFQLVLDGQYRWSVGADLSAFVGGNLNYRTHTKAGFGTEAVLDIDAYTLVDLQAGIEANDRRWRVAAFAHNVTDAYFWTNVAKVGDVARRITGQPITYGIQVSWRY